MAVLGGKPEFPKHTAILLKSNKVSKLTENFYGWGTFPKVGFKA